MGVYALDFIEIVWNITQGISLAKEAYHQTIKFVAILFPVILMI